MPEEWQVASRCPVAKNEKGGRGLTLKTKVHTVAGHAARCHGVEAESLRRETVTGAGGGVFEAVEAGWGQGRNLHEQLGETVRTLSWEPRHRGFEELRPHPSACDTISHRELVSIPDLLSGRLLE